MTHVFARRRRPSGALGITLLLPALMTACGVESDADDARFVAADLEASLLVAPGYGGCGDVDLYAHDATDTHALFIRANGFATDAWNAGATVTQRITLPSPDVSVVAQSGVRLTSATCSGAFPMPGPRVRHSWVAVSGVLFTEVTPDPAGTPFLPLATARARLRNAVLVDPTTGTQIRVADLEIPATSVGLYPP
ncbi:MAG: hypothetical protein H6733_00745 [Alphaproteobacteria bacterium]|nr:hypothetical protein [Alphaproteobacteria bacterium]